MRIVTKEEMRQIEINSLNYDLTFGRLMENAGSAATTFIRQTLGVEGLNCLVFCGNGNNGGDGFVAARKLDEYGANVVIILTGGTSFSEESLGMLEQAESLGIPILSLSEDADKLEPLMEQCDIIIDAIYGTGFRGELKDNAKAAAKLINSAIAAVISFDIPSGIECDSGKISEDAVEADFTVVFDSLKPLHINPRAIKYCGKIEVVNIGVPKEAYVGIKSKCENIITEKAAEIIPVRENNTHKGDYGRLLCIAGSRMYRGAASLAALGALRSGVGICTLGATEPVCTSTASHFHECTYLPLPENQYGQIDIANSLQIIGHELSRYSAVLIGPGLGDNPDNILLIEYILQNCTVPVLLDADAINAAAENINVLKHKNGPVILTPHPGEMAKLCSCGVEEIQSARIAYASDFAQNFDVTLVLKGSYTVISNPAGKILTNASGGPALAKGGSGDLLSGIIASFTAQGIPPFAACIAGVHFHGLAADSTSAYMSDYSMLPSDIMTEFGKILAYNGR